MIDPDKNSPSQLNNLFTAPGYINSKGNLWDGLNAAKTIGFNYESEAMTGSDALGLISQNVSRANTYVVVGLSPSHYVLVTGEVFDNVQKKCRFTINDPAGTRNYAYLDQYTDGNYTIDNVEIFEEQ